VTREGFAPRFPIHVTLRARAGLASLRRDRSLRVLRQAVSATAQRAEADSFRLVHFNLLSNHVHLVVEAASAAALARGVQGLAVRLARGWNRVLARKGKLFAERYHARVLRTPRETRHVLAYVLLNGRRHAAEGGVSLGRRWIDPYSSAAWFDGWCHPIRADEPWMKELLRQPCPTVPARLWLLTTGWRRWGLLAFDEVPGGDKSKA
jgi:REP element-mobilizing transposase RayT